MEINVQYLYDRNEIKKKNEKVSQQKLMFVLTKNRNG